MANWKKLDQGTWYNMAKVSNLAVQKDPADGLFWIYYSWDGNNWLKYLGQAGTATAAAQQTVLDSFAAGLG